MPLEPSRIKIKHQPYPHTKTCLACAALALLVAPTQLRSTAQATDCPAIRIVFARGSGEPLGGPNFSAFRDAVAPLLTDVDAEIYELGSSSQGGYQYPAIDLNTNSPGGLLDAVGAKISGGQSFRFGSSVKQGVGELKSYLASALSACPGTKFVLAGYSQGAMVMSTAIQEISAAPILYVANFGDPKLYLPEGRADSASDTPIACTDESSLSSYRAYVPDCRTFQGILEGYKPYQPNPSYEGKIGVWCNYHDLFCSSKIDWDNLLGAHTAYASDGHYVSAAQIIADKIHSALGTSSSASRPSSSHDLAILIDSTGSMRALIDNYKSEALRLATDILLKGGRVALYEYRDLADPFTPVLHCDFNTCNLTNFASKLDEIQTGGGGDSKESLLSASLTALNHLEWRVGANKSIVVLTDAGFHSPDRDKVTLNQVISRSLEIDPVHFYLLMPAEAVDDAARTLVAETGGHIFSSEKDLSLSTDYLTSLPAEPPVFNYGPTEHSAVTDLEYSEQDGVAYVTFRSDAYRVLIAIDDQIYGFTAEHELEIADLVPGVTHVISITPFSASGDRGYPRLLKFTVKQQSAEVYSETTPVNQPKTLIGVPATGFAPEKRQNATK